MQKKKTDNRCAGKDCWRTGRKRKTKSGIRYGKYCTTCDKKNWRKNNPMKYAYQNLLSNAKYRKIFCDLTFEEFKELCHETDYIAGKGKTSTSYSLDRRIEGKTPGYTKSNIQVLPLGVNSKKENERRKNKQLIYDWESGTFTVVSKSKVLENDSEDNLF